MSHIGSRGNKRLYGKRLTVVGKQVRAPLTTDHRLLKK